MTHNAVGETTAESPLLAHDWHKNLDATKLAAYVRYQFIWQKENALDWDAGAHARRYCKWDGGRSSYDGVRYSSRWGEIACSIKEHNADPGVWVHAHFSPAADMRLTQVNSGLPEVRPNMLHSKASPMIYTKYAGFMPDMIRQQFELARMTMDTRPRTSAALGLTPEDQQLYVLCDESYVTATPFFRHAFAAATQCVDAVEHYLWPAALHYEAHQRIYDSVAAVPKNAWWITDALKAAVIEIRQHWENYYG